MRVLFLTDTYRPSRTACANRASVLVSAMEEIGVDVQVLASSDSLIDAPAGYKQPSNVTFFKTFSLQKKTLINRLRNNFGGRRASIAVAEDMGDYDVVVCTTPPLLLTTSALTVAKRKHASLVLDVRDIWPDVAYEMGTFTPRSLYGKFFTHIAKRGFESADLVSTVSPGKVAKLRCRMPRGREDRVILIPNGIDETFLENVEDEAVIDKFRLDEGPICSYIGNVGLAQGLDTLLDIAKVRPRVRFLVFGKGAEEDRLRLRVNAESISNVRFCGTVNSMGVYTILKHSSVSYVPLVNSNLKDSIPTKMYEALACGCPVLLAAAGDSVRLLESAHLGKSAAPEDAEGLLRAFDDILAASYTEAQRNAAASYIVGNHSRQRFASSFARRLKKEFGEGVDNE